MIMRLIDPMLVKQRSMASKPHVLKSVVRCFVNKEWKVIEAAVPKVNKIGTHKPMSAFLARCKVFSYSLLI